MKRDIDKTLQKWKTSSNRKVLLLRGTRQIGKTYSIRNFAKTCDYFLEVKLWNIWRNTGYSIVCCRYNFE